MRKKKKNSSTVINVWFFIGLCFLAAGGADVRSGSGHRAPVYFLIAAVMIIISFVKARRAK